jgi:hypothetical protein
VKNWRPIALLCPIGKLFEKSLTKVLTQIALEHNLIPPEQMAFSGRTTTSALLYIKGIIRAAWATGKVATLLSLDISGAFNRVDRARLLAILHEKGIPKNLIVLVQSFLSQRTTTIKIPGFTSRPYAVNSGIPQGSPLSPILFLFFTAPLLTRLTPTRPGPCTKHVLAFSDDTNIITVSDTFSTNCRVLFDQMKICNEWANATGMKFAPHKFNCMHFSRSGKDSRGYDWRLLPNIKNLAAGDDFQRRMKILGVIFDPQLEWGAHMAHIEQIKIAPLRRAFKRMLGSEAGPTLQKALQLYKTVAIPAIFYAVEVWFSLHGSSKLKEVYLKFLRTTQNDFLRIIARAYPNAKIEFLEHELCTYNILVELDRRQTTALAKLVRKPVWTTINAAHTQVYECADVNRRLPGTKELRKKVDDPFFERTKRILKFGNTAEQLYIDSRANSRTHHSRTAYYEGVAQSMKALGHERASTKMQERWQDVCAEYRNRREVPTSILEEWGKHRLEAHRELSLHQSRVLIKLKTGSVRLQAFLYRMGPEFAAHPYCTCGSEWQTSFHLFVQCRHLDSARRELIKQTGHSDFDRWLMRDGPLAAKWAIKNFGSVQPDWLLRYLRSLDRDPTQ